MDARTTGKDVEPRGAKVGSGDDPRSGIGNERERASATGANVKCTENDSQNARFTASMVYNSARRRRVGTRFVSQTGAKLTQTQSISALTSTRHTGHSTDADNHLSMHD